MLTKVGRTGVVVSVFSLVDDSEVVSVDEFVDELVEDEEDVDPAPEFDDVVVGETDVMLTVGVVTADKTDTICVELMSADKPVGMVKT